MDRKRRQQKLRSVKVVEDVDAHTFDRNERFRSAASLLDPLTAPMLTQFRHEVRTRYSDGDPRFLCWRCHKPVYVSLSNAGITDDRDGRDAHFGHHAGTAEDCEWGTVGQNPRAIDATKYGGMIEGKLHYNLKQSLALMLEADREFSDIDVERVISHFSGWRKPDVSARFRGREVAFDLQLATTQLPDINGRQKFYEMHDIRYMWVTSSNDPYRLSLQAFQDIYWYNDGQIFAIDTIAEAISLDKRVLHVWVLSVIPRLSSAGLSTVWERKLISRDDIEWNTPSGRPKYSDLDFGIAALNLAERHFHDARRQLIKAVRRPKSYESEGISNTQDKRLKSLREANSIDEEGNSYMEEEEWDERAAEEKAARAWNEIARKVSVPLWREARQDKPFRAIGILASVALNKKMDSSRSRPDKMTDILNNFLEFPEYRGWTSALQCVAKAYDHEHLLAQDSTRRKIYRNLNENHSDLNRRYAPILDVIFPRSAFFRVVGPPAKIEDV